MNITELVRAAGGFEPTLGFLERFEALVRSDEREACAGVCDDIDAEYEGQDVLATWCSQAIRARGQK
jgi:hypothetical protein